jgi:hypothetical protein
MAARFAQAREGDFGFLSVFEETKRDEEGSATQTAADAITQHVVDIVHDTPVVDIIRCSDIFRTARACQILNCNQIGG